MSIITSIHQPNQDLFLIFDSVYVLAKGGVCVYSGLPKNLRPYLNECRIDCNENQIPIEVLIKLSFKGMSDKNVRQLMQTTNNSQNIKELNSELDKTQEFLKTKKGFKNKSKNFKIIDFWYLMIRFLYRNYVSQLNSILKTLIVFSAMNIFIINASNEKITEIDGCFEPNITTNISCIEREDNKSILNQNQNLLFISMQFNYIVLIIIQTSGYIQDFQIFRTEHKNCE